MGLSVDPKKPEEDNSMKKLLVLTMVFVLSISCCAAAQATTYLGMGTGGETGTY